MSSLPSNHPALALHLTDSTLTPVLSSTTTIPSPNPQSDALSSLTTAALSAYISAAHLSLGLPQRIMLETSSGPLILHSFLNPQSSQLSLQQNLDRDPDSHSALLEETRGALRPMSASTVDATLSDSLHSGSGSSSVAEGHGRGQLELSQNSQHRHIVNGVDKGKGLETEELEEDEDGALSVSLAPLLIGTVVAPGREYMREARMAAVGLERLGGRFQREWVRELEQGIGIGRNEEEEGG